MVMETMQIRMQPALVESIDKLVSKGLYANRADVIRDAVRHFVWEQQVGTIENTGDSVKEVRRIRKQLSKEPIDLEKIDKL